MRCIRGSCICRRPSFCMRRGSFQSLEYTFKHALTHEVTYGTLLQDRRKAVHARIVGAIERLYAGPADRARGAAGSPRPPWGAVG